jgi:hypothetical protein
LIKADKKYTIPELAKESGWSDNTIRTMFRHHPLAQKKPGPTNQRVAVRIPGTIALQVFQDLQREPNIVKLPKAKKEPRKVYLYPERHKKALGRAEQLAQSKAVPAA